MAKDTITLQTPTAATALKMLARKSDPPPRILTHPSADFPNTAWVISGDRAFMGIMPVAGAMRVIQHQQPWELTKNTWGPTGEFDWEGQVWKRLADFGDVEWDIPLTVTRTLAESQTVGLCRVLIDETHYWCIQELFFQCANLLREVHWSRSTHPGFWRVLRASIGWKGEGVTSAYIMAIEACLPSVELAERHLTSGTALL